MKFTANIISVPKANKKRKVFKMNRNFAKISALILASSMLLSLTACDTAQTSSSQSQTETSSEDNTTTIADSADVPQSSEAESKEESTTTTSEETKAPVGVDGVQTNGQLVVDIDGHTWGISLYGGGDGANYASYLNLFKEKVGSNVNVFNMVVPTAGAYYMPQGYEDYNASHQDSINSIANKLVGVINVDGYSALEAHKDEYIYTRTDHHWQPLGAYYAAKEFCEMALVPAKELSTYEKVDIEGFVGTMYAFTDYNERIKKDPDVFTYYVPSTKYEATYFTTDCKIDPASQYVKTIFVEQPVGGAYSTFMGGDKKIVKIETENKNGRKLCVFKDSYGNAEIPFLVDSFEEIYVCDIRYFDLYAPEFVLDNGITDVLFTMCTFSAVGVNAEHIKSQLLDESREGKYDPAETDIAQTTPADTTAQTKPAETPAETKPAQTPAETTAE